MFFVCAIFLRRPIFESCLLINLVNSRGIMPGGNNKKKSSIPDRWEDYEPIGDPLPGFRFITFKVPLKSVLCQKLPEEMRFSPSSLVKHCKGKGWNLGLVVDLTNTMRYYDPMEFKEKGIEYQKIFTQGHVVPSQDVRKRFSAVVDDFVKRKPDPELLIGVHCTHGVNRTGYLVCRYMVDRLGKDAEETMSDYKIARGYAVERENYVNDLLTGPKISDEEYEQFQLDNPVEPYSAPQNPPKFSNHYSRNIDNGSSNQRVHNGRFKDTSSSCESHDRGHGRRRDFYSHEFGNGESSHSRDEAGHNEPRCDVRNGSHRNWNSQDNRQGFDGGRGGFSNARRNFSTQRDNSYHNGFMGNGGGHNFQGTLDYNQGRQNNFRGSNNRYNQHPYRGHPKRNSYGGYSYGNSQMSQSNDDYGSFGYNNHQRSSQRWT